MVNLGMKEARLRIRGDKEHPLGLCLNCGKPSTNRELNSCSEPKCVKECRSLYRWVCGVIRHLTSPQHGAYVNYQMGQGGL